MAGEALAARLGLSRGAYELLAWQAQLLRLGKLTMSYKSAGERRMYEGLLALVGKRERDAGFADRAEYGIDAMTTDRDEARESVVDLASRRGARSRGAGRPAVKGASRRASRHSGDSSEEQRNGNGPVYCGERMFVADLGDGCCHFEPSCGHTVVEVLAAVPPSRRRANGKPSVEVKSHLTRGPTRSSPSPCGGRGRTAWRSRRSRRSPAGRRSAKACCTRT